MDIEKASIDYLCKVADGKRTTGYCDEDFIEGAKFVLENQENLLQNFINQFDENHELNELSDEDWKVSEFLKWLMLNGFKLVKGEKHSSSKVKTLAAVDVEKLENIQSFVEYAVTESRFKQALENVFPNDEPIENKKLGDVIRWVVNDVVKEEMDTMADNKIEPKDVNKYLSSKVRDMFFKLV